MPVADVSIRAAGRTIVPAAAVAITAVVITRGDITLLVTPTVANVVLRATARTIVAAAFALEPPRKSIFLCRRGEAAPAKEPGGLGRRLHGIFRRGRRQVLAARRHEEREEEEGG